MKGGGVTTGRFCYQGDTLSICLSHCAVQELSVASENFEQGIYNVGQLVVLIWNFQTNILSVKHVNQLKQTYIIETV